MYKNFFKFSLIFLIFVFILGFLIRLSGVPTNNVLFLFDNGMDLLLVKRLIIEHKILLVGPQSAALGGHFHGVFWSYFLAIPFLFGKGNPVFFTLFMVICSTLSIFLVFICVKKILNIHSALFASLIYSFGSFSIATSRFIWNPYPIVWLIPFYVWVLWEFLRRKSYAIFALSFLTSLIFHLEAIYGVTLIPLLILLVVVDLFRQKELKEKFIRLLVSFILFILPLLPSLVFDLRHNFIITSSLFKTVKESGKNLTHQKGEVEKPFSQRIILRTNDLYQYTIQSVTPWKSLNLLIFLISFVAFLKAVKKKDKLLLAFIALCSLAIFSAFFVFLTLKYSVWSYYWIGIPAFYLILVSCLFGYLLKNVEQKYVYVFYILLAIVFFSFSPLSKAQYWYKGEINPGSGNLTTQLSIVRKIYEDTKGQPFSVYVLTPPVYDYVYRYLFWWQGYTVYKHFPQDAKQSLLYLIIESNESDPGGLYFQQNVVRTISTPIKKFNFPDNIVVKKFLVKPNDLPVNPNYFPPSAGL